MNGAYVMQTIGGAERKTMDMKDWKHHHGMMHHENMKESQDK
jgi:hypothetical protein